MADKIQCDRHGEASPAFVCVHLSKRSVGLGFNRNEPTEDDPLPDAWCDDCEIIRVAHDGWDEESEKLAQIKLVCSGCYNQARIRNTRTSVTFDDLAQLRWKCVTCEEWHSGPCLDFGSDAPIYWTEDHQKASRRARLRPLWGRKYPKTFLSEDLCATDDEYFYVRGNIHLPIIGTDQNFVWGVWGSLSRDNFSKLWEMYDHPKRAELQLMFSWLSNQIEEYPDTLNLKMYADIQAPGWRPHFQLEATDHPLSQEYHNGITPQRVKEIMLGRLRDLQ